MDSRDRMASMQQAARSELRETLTAMDMGYWYGAARHATDLATRLHRMDQVSMDTTNDEQANNAGDGAGRGDEQ